MVFADRHVFLAAIGTHNVKNDCKCRHTQFWTARLSGNRLKDVEYVEFVNYVVHYILAPIVAPQAGVYRHNKNAGRQTTGSSVHLVLLELT